MGLDIWVAIIGLGIAMISITIDHLFPNFPRWMHWMLFSIGMGLFLIGCIFVTYEFFSNYSLEILKSGDVVLGTRWLFAIPMLVAFVAVGMVVVHFMKGGMIEIITPEMGQSVNPVEIVSGLVFPKDSFVQVFILHGDSRWHPHEATTNGGAWKVGAKIGAEKAPGKSHKLIAISGAKKITQPLSTLPRGEAKSRAITVYRITENP
jgi:hypothetical protein